MVEVNAIRHLADESQGTDRQYFGKISRLHRIKKHGY